MNNYYERLVNRIELFCITKGAEDSIRKDIESLREFVETNRPKKAKYIIEEPYGGNYFVCPSCENDVEVFDCYCKCCGQMLNWEEESND